MTTPATTAEAQNPTTANETDEAYNLVPGTDRCDRCGAQAFMATAHVNGVLLWCAHHAREHKDALKKDVRVTVIADKRHVLSAKPSM